MVCGCGWNRATSRSNMCWDGATTRSGATLRSAVIGRWCAAHFRFAGGLTVAYRPRRWPKRTMILAPIWRGGGEKRPRVSWPETLRLVRGWLEPYVMLWRYWRAFSGMPPPKELKALLEQVFSGTGLYLYAHYQQTSVIGVVIAVDLSVRCEVSTMERMTLGVSAERQRTS